MSLIYQATCSDCSQPVDIEAKLDKDQDLILDVTPCANCMKAARALGYEEGGEDAK